MDGDLTAAVRADTALAEGLLRLVRKRLVARSPELEHAGGAGAELLAAASTDRWLEAIVERHGRPSLLILGGMYEPPLLSPWAERLEAAEKVLPVAIGATGRVEVRGMGAAHLGTAWMIEGNIAVTNRHVAELFTRTRNGTFEIRNDTNGQPYRVFVDFLAEAGNPASREAEVTGVLYIASSAQHGPDVAFLELDAAHAPAPPPLGDDGALAPEEFLATIGYPAFDADSNGADMQRIFGGRYDVKRLAPGWVKQAKPLIFTHDCTTLGGNSGSLVLSLRQGAAVGLHYSGQKGVENRAVRIAAVKRLLDRAQGREVIGVRALGLSGPEAAPSLDGRAGYVSTGFLGEGVTVPAPTTVDPTEDVLTPLIEPGSNGSSDFELRYHHFSAFMHARTKLPMFTAVNVDGSAVLRAKRTDEKWFLDPRIPAASQTGAELYTGNALRHGQMVGRLDPAWGDEAATAVADTYFYTNCAPQHAALDTGTWLALTGYVMEDARTHGFRMAVFTGPVFADSDPVYRKTFTLPQAFWKVMVTQAVDGATGRPVLTSSAYVLAQAEFVVDLRPAHGPFRTHQVPIGRVAQWARLKFDRTIVATDAMRAHPEAGPYRMIESPADLLLS